MLQQLVFVGDRAFYGKTLSMIGSEIRQELLKRSTIKPVSFVTSDKLTLQGLMVTRTRPKATLLLCHGYKGAKEIMYGCISLFPEWNILLFDFRAHGQSEGKVTSIGYHEYKDVIAAAQFLKAQPGNAKLPLMILGISMGGAAALKATDIEPTLCDALIIDSAYAKLSTTVLESFSLRTGLPYYPFFPLLKYMFRYIARCDVHDMNPVESVSRIKQPILFIHSCSDEHTPPQHTQLQDVVLQLLFLPVRQQALILRCFFRGDGHVHELHELVRLA
ncbi:unnamed protein product, partial [Sphagnum tenellum]